MYRQIKFLYILGAIKEAGLDNAVKENWISEAQKKEIMDSKPST